MLLGLYGAGTLGRRIGRSLDLPFVFVDDTPGKQGTIIDGHQVLSLSMFAERAARDNSRLYICIYQPGFSFQRKREEIQASYQDFDCRPFTELALGDAVESLPFLFFEDPRVLLRKLNRYEEIRDLLCDDLSKQTLDAHLRFRLKGNFDDVLSTPRSDVPFLTHRLPKDISYVDAGAFDGDTAQDFVEMTNGNFRQICLVEPDASNAARASERLAKLGLLDRVEIRQEAISSERGYMGFNALGSVGSSLDANAEHKVPTRLLSDFDLGGPLYFKLDIEGAESGALRACRDFIADRKVFLGISAYHLPDDLLDIATIIRELDTSYELYLRCHGSSGEDLMLYALPTAI
ncbi:FkbM family methyltransferase [Paraburkholderia caribensis]|uniref:FkbM family methyltransferase n=1 Tax=Paraburkholderia caribensis TaxID=75105 RepID=UPI002866DE51|nr:FkbM family methyltransferase [Paraburkholderia caribensis]MDR6383863.1 FkbM family methyltransferase [Paraburkholderia caribensis]